MPEFIPLPLFRGKDDEDISKYLRSVDIISRANEWSKTKQLHMLIASLDGYARTWYDRMVAMGELGDPGTYDELVTALEAQFHNAEVKERLLDRFDALKQKDKETVAEYETRFSDIADALGEELTMRERLRKFRRSLRPEITAQIKEEHAHDWKTLVSLAAKKEYEATKTHKSASLPTVDQLAEKVRKLELQLAQVNQQPSHGKCATCHSDRHSTAACKQKAKPKAADARLITVDADLNTVEKRALEASESSRKSPRLNAPSAAALPSPSTKQLPAAVAKPQVAPTVAVPKPVATQVTEPRFRGRPPATTLNHIRPANGPYDVKTVLAKTNAGLSLKDAIVECPRIRSEVQQMVSQSNEPSVRMLDGRTLGTPRVQVDHNGITFEALVDGGASVNIASTKLVKELQLKIDKDETFTCLHLGDGRDAFTRDRVTIRSLKLGPLTFDVDCLVLKNANYNLLLGRTFLRDTNSFSDWKRGTFSFRQGDQYHEVDVDELSQPSDLKAIQTYSFQEEDLRHVVALPANKIVEATAEKKDVLEDIFVSHLSSEVQEAVLRIIATHPDVLSQELGVAQVMTSHVIITSGMPIKLRAYRVSPKEDAFIQEEIQRMLAAGIIRPSTSSWSFPVVTVTKKDGKLRFCVDYRRLNAITKKDAYPLPLTDEVLESLANHRFYTNLDLHAGYWQIPVNDADVEKTAFVVKQGIFEFTAMPFGLTNAPATFQRTMDQLLQSWIGKGVMVYLDDICIYSNDLEEHLRLLEEVFATFDEHKLRVNVKKCSFLQPQVTFLGHLIDQNGIHVDVNKCSAINALPTPRSATEVRSFLGMASYYRKFIKSFSDIAEPLIGLLRKGQAFVWAPAQQHAFENLRLALTNPPVLVPPDPNGKYVLHTDASDFAIGAELALEQDGVLRTVAFYNRTLAPAERRYATTDKEALAVVAALKHFRQYLWGCKFTVYTDHQALLYVLNFDLPQGRLARWAAFLREFDVEVRYRKGTENVVADALSRSEALRTVESRTLTADDKPLLIRAYLMSGTLPDALDPNVKHSIRRAASKHFVRKGELFRRRCSGKAARVILKPEERKSLLLRAHDGLAHFGVQTVYELLAAHYYWPNLYQEVKDYVASCETCQKFRRDTAVHVHATIPTSGIFQRWSLDFVGPLPPTTKHHKYILVCTEHLTRWPVAIPCFVNDAPTVARHLYCRIFTQFGVPQSLLTDRGTHFHNELLSELANLMEYRHCFTTAYNPQCNGMTERWNATLITSLAKLAEEFGNHWDDHIATVEYAYRIRKHSATGKSPFEMMFGIEPRPIALLQDSVEDLVDRHLELKQLPQIRAAGITESVDIPSRFAVDDSVLLKSLVSGKLLPTWQGPYTIAAVYKNNFYTLRAKSGALMPLRVNGRRLKLHHRRK